MEKAAVCMREGEWTSLWIYANIKLAVFRAANSLPRKTRYVLRHFRRRHLTAYEVSRSEETRKVEYALIFEGVLMPFT